MSLFERTNWADARNWIAAFLAAILVIITGMQPFTLVVSVPILLLISQISNSRTFTRTIILGLLITAIFLVMSFRGFPIAVHPLWPVTALIALLILALWTPKRVTERAVHHEQKIVVDLGKKKRIYVRETGAQKDAPERLHIIVDGQEPPTSDRVVIRPTLEKGTEPVERLVIHARREETPPPSRRIARPERKVMGDKDRLSKG